MNSLVFEFGARTQAEAWTFAIALCLLWLYRCNAAKKDKKKSDTTAPAAGPRKFPFDPKKLAWPSPPNIARVRWLDYFAGMKVDYTPAPATKPKASWMDRLAGSQPEGEKVNVKTFPFQMIGPYGIAFDSKGLVYVADQRVGAVFIFNLETRDTQLIRNGFEAHFGWINGLAIDDDDRLFVSDAQNAPGAGLQSQARDGKPDHGRTAGSGRPGDRYGESISLCRGHATGPGVVYDADTLKLLRRIGTGGKNHFLTTPGDFAAPEGVALDKDQNVYVTDTLNDRVEIFDADGNFISTFGKTAMVPGYFTRPKGIAVDADGHIWVADAMQDRLQVFNHRASCSRTSEWATATFPASSSP